MSILLNADNIHPSKGLDTTKEGVITVSEDNIKALKYPKWAPVWDPRQNLKFKNLKPYVHTDRGYFGDPSFDSLFKGTGATHKRISPKLGTEVEGIQLSKLTDKQKDDLALLVEQRGVVVFRGQDFKHLPFEDLEKWGEYYGPLHVHATSGAPLGQSHFHMTFRRGSKDEQKRLFANRLNKTAFHSDTSYETQPPGITLLTMLQTGAGGDTQFIDTVEAYERLSPTIKAFISNLKGLHTSQNQENQATRNGGITRKPFVQAIQPLVRWHPVLQKKSLYIHPIFCTRILGLKLEESDFLLKFLSDHVNSLLDAHIRASWDENTVVVWDNRRVFHTATDDWDSNDIRTSFRITPMAERPVGSEEEYQSWTPEKEEKNIKDQERQLSLTPEEFYNEFYADK